MLLLLSIIYVFLYVALAGSFHRFPKVKGTTEGLIAAWFIFTTGILQDINQNMVLYGSYSPQGCTQRDASLLTAEKQREPYCDEMVYQ